MTTEPVRSGSPGRPVVRTDDTDGRAAAIDVLRAGGIVAFPTDTVYGIAVAIATPGGIQRLFHVKRRAPEKGIVLLIADIEQAEAVGVLSEPARRLARAFWPGPLTLIVPVRPDAPLPGVLTGGGRGTVGIRVPDHPAPRAICAAVGPLPTTSANRSGEADALDAETVVLHLGDGVDLVLDGGRTTGGTASTVLDLTVEPAAVLRLGALGVDRLRTVVAVADGPS